MEFTAMERAVLEWFSLNSRNPSLVAQIRECEAGEREITSIGFFTELRAPSAESATDNIGRVAHSGCAVFAPELEIAADCILHTKGGRPQSLEVYAIGGGHPLKTSTFEVRAIEENIVDLRPPTHGA